ncbi:MAG: hypothetical protein NT126_04435, partial [Bacteroidetes bacterium]|nr:hypothetical protein [Bacteroidota bacterium]
GDENYYYRSFSLRDYLGRKDGWNEIMFQFVLPQLKGNNDKLSVYFWNKEKQTFYLDDFELVLYR